tara:strand:- start:391 stop:894 length:504 start_codon:yes stop_codon:yes gene_type:complete
MLIDDDTYPILKNLVPFLKNKDYKTITLYGQQCINKKNYIGWCGGGGGVFSRNTLRHIVNSKYTFDKCRYNSIGKHNQVWAKCLPKINVSITPVKNFFSQPPCSYNKESGIYPKLNWNSKNPPFRFSGLLNPFTFHYIKTKKGFHNLHKKELNNISFWTNNYKNDLV